MGEWGGWVCGEGGCVGRVGVIPLLNIVHINVIPSVH